jgi:hypothetical protein
MLRIGSGLEFGSLHSAKPPSTVSISRSCAVVECLSGRLLAGSRRRPRPSRRRDRGCGAGAFPVAPGSGSWRDAPRGQAAWQAWIGAPTSWVWSLDAHGGGPSEHDTAQRSIQAGSEMPFERPAAPRAFETDYIIAVN